MTLNIKRISNTRMGFTMVELLIVIAIIGILASVVLTSLSTAREKARDSKRTAQITQIARALELFYDSRQSYPSTTPAGFTGEDAGVQLLAALALLPPNPIPPLGTNPTYIYHGVYMNAGTPTECTAANTPCLSYALGITLERSDSVVLANDADQSVGTFYGSNPDCDVNTAGTERCFDVKP